jgi:hypothetical protein
MRSDVMLTGVFGGISHSLKTRGLFGDTRGSLEQTASDILRPSETTAERYGNCPNCCRDIGFSGFDIADVSSSFSLRSISGFARR